MIKGIYTSAVGMQSRILEEEISSNNLANLNTTGFKKDNVHFKNLLDGNLVQLDLDGGQQGLAGTHAVQTSFVQGELRSTNNSLDVALDGSGFLVVLTEEGEAYTRNGHFMLDEEGQLTTARGDKVIGTGGPILLFPGDVEIRENGEIYQNGGLVDELKIVDFEQPYALNKIGEGIFEETENSNLIEAEQTSIRQGYLEESNVNPIGEMVKLISIAKSFQAGQRAIQAQNSTLEKTVNQVGRF